MYLTQGLHIPRIFILCHYFSLRIIVSSYHEKIYLTKGFSHRPTSDFYNMLLFFTSYHSIIVSRKNVFYSGPFIYLGFFILCHYFSLRIIVSSYHEKMYLTQGLHIPRIFILCRYFSLRIIVSSYHEKIYLTEGFSYSSDFYNMLLFFTSYHSIIV